MPDKSKLLQFEEFLEKFTEAMASGLKTEAKIDKPLAKIKGKKFKVLKGGKKKNA